MAGKRTVTGLFVSPYREQDKTERIKNKTMLLKFFFKNYSLFYKTKENSFKKASITQNR